MSVSTDQKPAETPVDASKADEAAAIAALPIVEAPSIDPAAAPAAPIAAEAESEKAIETKPDDASPAAAPAASSAPEAAKPEARIDEAKIDPTKTDGAKTDEAKIETKTETKIESDAKPKPPIIALTPASKRFRDSASAQIAAARERITHRNLSGAMTMALAVGVLSVGVAGGAGYLAGLSEKSTTHAMALEQSVLRIEAEMLAVRGEMERATRAQSASASETGQRLERIEKAQTEPLAKLSKLAEMVEKLRSVQASTIAASKIDAGDVTGSVSPQQGKGRQSTIVVEAWVLREFDKDVALIEGKRGLLEIAVGDDIPGLGRVEGFRKHDGRWAVVTSKGLIVSR